ncbi:2-oxoglutarate dehydrogenase E1 component [Buchnera aphidicola]|uniref:2-oxoglutarate dehydrogenase E1 component n=1 Tax=Buchnera aphidicola TaxID=9 RepID=UPI00094CA0C0|nr:2-oxoglutarate dehydrogenase E1 component [Buchnera aphidicola]
MKKNKKTNPFFRNGWLYANNQLFLEDTYKNFLSNSQELDISWKNAFYTLSDDYKKDHTNQKIGLTDRKKKNIENENFLCNTKNTPFNNYCDLFRERFLNFINSYRIFGHYVAHLNPLVSCKKALKIPELSKTFHQIKKEELNSLIHFNFLLFKKNISSFKEIYLFFKKKYCKYIGFEYMHLNKLDEKQWLQTYIETHNVKNTLSNAEKEDLLKNLIKSTTFEKFIHTKFPGNKRFSLEGCDVLIPALKAIIAFCIHRKTKKIFLGMAHRGRLNVMFNVLQCNVLKMFQNNWQEIKQHNGTGDVKYHLGIKKKITLGEKKIEIHLLNNPSHLEIVTPVVAGCCKFYLENQVCTHYPLPIIIHGDAAFTGQGVIQETLNMSQTPGYGVGGSVHIIINNQISFTTSKKKYLRSSKYCTDIAKMIDSPIFHVNADQPESVIFSVKLALKFRYLFKKDVFIDLVCYRRLGHNEVDDPSITQPFMYALIKKHKRICRLYSKKLLHQNNYSYEDLYQAYNRRLILQLKLSNIRIKKKLSEDYQSKATKLVPFKNISYQMLKKIARKLFELPKNLIIHRQVKKIFYNRMQMANNKSLLDWGAIENLAYSTLMYYGITCRLTGEDVRRGTFSHRHTTVICQKKNITYIPLKHLSRLTGSFYIWDSVLSEESVLAFEYGYSIASKAILNIWEAQFGDFSNGAQVVIDQFIASGAQKWGCASSLTMLLPHGYEGQGPEHSSGRLERYLQLCAQKNIRICVPTTVSQMYYILINQGRSLLKRPLILFTPKSLLRNPLTFISIKDLFFEKFHKILLTNPINQTHKINRIIFCSGKIYYELLDFWNKNKIFDVNILRIEQLYPFPHKKINNILKKYANIKYFIWCQEEPKNQGGWSYIYFYFKKYVLKNNNGQLFQYTGRPKFASTSEGSFLDHQKQQKKIIESAFYI